MDRRRFLQSIAVAAATPAAALSCQSLPARQQQLSADPRQIIDLPVGFDYDIVSRRGDLMSDGLRVPAAHDGMAAFQRDGDIVALICNHELTPTYKGYGAFTELEDLKPELRERLYDRGKGITPSLGGTTTTLFDTSSRRVTKQYLSLAGTDTNCAGGPTPWGSWLTCEESFASPTSHLTGDAAHYERSHGYVFEVDASDDELQRAVPLRAMGRFEHEAAAVHAPTGIIYLTEDKWHSLLYRFLPNTPGRLSAGGRLQALAITDQPSLKTHNWEQTSIAVNESLTTEWIDLEDVDTDQNDLRHRGAKLGAAMFARGEGITPANGEFAFCCTIGGEARLGQVFSYRPSPFEGLPEESQAPGTLTLIAEAEKDALLKNCDNLVAAPWGDLIICEDVIGATHPCGVKGIRPDGSQYVLASNTHSKSEVAGVCFSPDGKTLFLNIQYPGMTIAIHGPWSQFA